MVKPETGTEHPAISRRKRLIKFGLVPSFPRPLVFGRPGRGGGAKCCLCESEGIQDYVSKKGAEARLHVKRQCNPVQPSGEDEGQCTELRCRFALGSMSQICVPFGGLCGYLSRPLHHSIDSRGLASIPWLWAAFGWWPLRSIPVRPFLCHGVVQRQHCEVRCVERE